MSPVFRRQWFATLSPNLRLELAQTAEFWLRPEQHEPTLTPGVEGDYYLWLLITGRGWGKTRTAASLVHRWARDRRSIGSGVILIAGPNYGDVRHKIVEAQDSGILALAHRNFRPEWSPANGRGILRWPNGVVGVCVSGSDPDAFRGFNASRLWAEELTAWQDPERAWCEGIAPALRRGANPRAIVTCTPLPLSFLGWLMQRKRAIVTRGTLFDNDALAPAYLEQMKDQYEQGSPLWRQEIMGEIVRDNPRALFRHDWFAAGRLHETPTNIVRKVIGVDPGVVGDSAQGNQCGIVVVAQTANGHYHVLADASCSGDPLVWASEVRRVFETHGADLIVAERNNGGKLVEMAIKAAGPGDVPVKLIWSSHGKLTRAEPVAQLYRRGLVHHVGAFQALEQQAAQWWPGSSLASPDRMDALVFAVAELAGLGQTQDAAEPDRNETIGAYA